MTTRFGFHSLLATIALPHTDGACCPLVQVMPYSGDSLDVPGPCIHHVCKCSAICKQRSETRQENH